MHIESGQSPSLYTKFRSKGRKIHKILCNSKVFNTLYHQAHKGQWGGHTKKSCRRGDKRQRKVGCYQKRSCYYQAVVTQYQNQKLFNTTSPKTHQKNACTWNIPVGFKQILLPLSYWHMCIGRMLGHWIYWGTGSRQAFHMPLQWHYATLFIVFQR